MPEALDALYVADAYATGLEQGVKSMEYLEMSKTPYLGEQQHAVAGDA